MDKIMCIKQIFNDFCDNLVRRTYITTEDTIRYYWFASMMQNDPQINLNNYSLEYPYPIDEAIFAKDARNRIAKKALDFLYNNGSECFCMEIKFHRNPDSESTYAHPDAAGSLFNDIFRVSVFTPGVTYRDSQEKKMTFPDVKRRFLLYVTDDEMHQYFSDYSKSQKQYISSYRRPLQQFYHLQEGEIWEHAFGDDDVPDTFKESALWALANCFTISRIPQIKLLCRKDDLIMNNNSFKFDSSGKRSCHVRLYEVLS